MSIPGFLPCLLHSTLRSRSIPSLSRLLPLRIQPDERTDSSRETHDPVVEDRRAVAHSHGGNCEVTEVGDELEIDAVAFSVVCS